ncbi:MAG: BTAD domain-containing putative transcriptional regulator [Mycobacteriales bacterium]
MEIRILGPLEARVAGRSITPTAAKPRQVLSLLALQPEEVVPVPVLMEELWGVAPPRSALTTLQTYILQLRRGIAAALPAGAGAAKDVLVRKYNGYTLAVPPEDVDVKRYERLAAAGRRAAEAGDLSRACDLLHDALALWRGQALVDVQIGSRLYCEVAWLEDSRLSLLESRIDIDLQLGRHDSVLSELAVLTARSRMNENLCQLFMIALYRSGRRWQALDAFRTLRQTLVDELGVEPSARLQQLQRAMLNSDPALDQPTEHRRTASLVG